MSHGNHEEEIHQMENAVDEFAAHMKESLSKNMHKGTVKDWRSFDIFEMARQLKGNLNDLIDEASWWYSTSYDAKCRKESKARLLNDCIDTANYCLIIACRVANHKQNPSAK